MARETPSTRDILEDRVLHFNCYEFTRGVKVGRPLSRRWVSAEQCLCTRDTAEICDASILYSLQFHETSGEEEAKYRKETYEKRPDIPPDRIGAFSLNNNYCNISVPPHFMDALWTAALAADGVLRSIQLSIQPFNSEIWNVFEATFKEELAEPFELPTDKQSHPKVGPPRVDPVIGELRRVQALLRPRIWPGIAIIAVGVLIALWIAKLWR
jgi:hypothetical protein